MVLRPVRPQDVILPTGKDTVRVTTSVFCSGNPKSGLDISVMLSCLEWPLQSFWSDLWWQLFSRKQSHFIPMTDFLQGLRTHDTQGEGFLSRETNVRFRTATRVQELSHANDSNKHNLNPWFSLYGSFIFSVLCSNFPPFSLASFFFAAKPYLKWEGNY